MNTNSDHMEENFNAREAFMSMLPGKMALTEKTLIEIWLSMHCENPQSPFFGRERQCVKIINYWLKHEKHDPTQDDRETLLVQESWDDYINNYVKHEIIKNNSDTVNYWIYV